MISEMRRYWPWVIAFALIVAVIVGYKWHKRALYAQSSGIMGGANESLSLNIEHSLSIGADKLAWKAFLEGMISTLRIIPHLSGRFQLSQSAILDAYTKDIALPVFRCRIHMTFRLDQQEKLTGYEQKSVCSE